MWKRPYLRILYVDSDRQRRMLVLAAFRKDRPSDEVFVSSTLPLAKAKLITESPFDVVICASSIDDKRSGDGLLFAKSLHDDGQRVITLTPGSKGLPGIPTVSVNSPTMCEELMA